jgi:hypothetical protein
MKNLKVILELKKGIIDAIKVPANVDIEIRDYDLAEDGPELKKDNQGKSYNPIYF